MIDPQGKPKSQFKKCDYCGKRISLDSIHKLYYQCNCHNCKESKERELLGKKSIWICNQCNEAITKSIPSGNKVIDDFIKSTLSINWYNRKMYQKMEFEFVPYEKFKNIEFIAEGGFSKIYKAFWEDGPISYWNHMKQGYNRVNNMIVALKELNNSENINSAKELNELKIFHNCIRKEHFCFKGYRHINKYYGITKHPDTKNYMIIMKYCESGDLTHYITKDFFNLDWSSKLNKLCDIITGLKQIHNAGIIHQDYHSGNIFLEVNKFPITGDLGLSKSAIEPSLNDESNEIYGVIPYVAPEIFQEQKYTKASDIYSFGMIMWELMTGRKPFWDKSHDTDLIIEICDGLRPPIVTNAPEGYIELMKECWNSDPKKRPNAHYLHKKIYNIIENEWKNKSYNPTEIIKSPDIGPITNNPDAVYKSRPLSEMIKSAESTRKLRSVKRKIDNDDDKNDKITKKIKLLENDKNDYITREVEFDI